MPNDIVSPLDRLKRVLEYVSAWREANPVYMPFPAGTPTMTAKQLAEAKRQADMENQRLMQQLAETRRHNLAAESLARQEAARAARAAASQPSDLGLLLGLGAGLFGGSSEPAPAPTTAPPAQGGTAPANQPAPALKTWRPGIGSGSVIQPTPSGATILLPQNLRVK